MMKAALSSEELFRREALGWFESTNTTPNRQISEEQIVEIYKKIKAYAESDLLLAEYYEANHLHL